MGPAHVELPAVAPARPGRSSLRSSLEDPELAGTANARGRLWGFFGRYSPALAMICAVVAAVAVQVHLMRGTTFYVDEWTAIFQYGWSPRQLLEPVNGHNAFLGRATWYAVMAVFGIGDYLPFRLLGLAFNLWAALALFVYVLRRVGKVPAVAVATLSLFLGSSFHTILWPASAIGVFAVGALVLTLLCLENQTVRGGVGACVLILLAFGCGGMGVIVYAAAAAEIVLRRHWRHWWVIVLPPLPYALWLATFSGGGPDGITGAHVLSAPAYVGRSLEYATAGLFGAQEPSLAPWTLVFYIALAAVLAWLNRGRIDLPRVTSISVAALTFWGLAAIFRGDLGEPGAPRYIVFGAVPLVLILLELGRGLFRTVPGTLGLLAVTGFCLVGNVGELTIAAANFRYIGDIHRAELAALEAIRHTAAPGYVPPGEWARYVQAAQYFAAIDRFGSPALPVNRLLGEIDGARMAADEVLLAAGGVAIVAAPPASTCVDVPRAEFSASNRSAVTVSNSLPTPVELRLRRFGAGVRLAPDAIVASGQSVTITVTGGLSSPPWQVRATAPVPACGAS